ncbi:Chaperone protein HscA [Corynebacterium kalinowskii]|uniref:Chaperone protein HscA n=1 Tax=Corynebacterium kalinowskii TaxID=2675216 RepID=A0A6B8VEJ4_9CORY|nr:Hsp70 family protein [Corynebacterium kalinowskii]QGU01479.1 Chaperone protein HscA [Corynebacterium kalinowskii]
MRFGIDFGTTRTVIACVDRGNYPVVNVMDTVGDSQEYIPTVVALDGDQLVAGWKTEDLPAKARSFKRLLSAPGTNTHTPVRIGDAERPLGEVLDVFAREVVEQLREQFDTDEIEVVLGVPANSHSAQRLLTLAAFTQAGATVVGMVNEPSAAAFEYTHRHARTLNTKRRAVLVYDLGGGTFDCTLMRIEEHEHVVEKTLGIAQLGGDDFDRLLADLAQAQLGREQDLVDEARFAKEQLKPQSRRLILEVGDEDVIIPVEEFYEAATPLVEQTYEVLRPLIGDSENLTDTDIAGIYLVGGASSLPLIPRMLRERYGHRVHRSPLPTASTAVGLAIASDPDSDFRLRDKVSRGIGVFRERDGGAEVTLDTVLEPGLEEQHTAERRYWAAHNVGWFRYVEFSAGSPGDFSVLAELLVPFDPNLRHLSQEELAKVPVQRWPDGYPWPEVVETISMDSNGIAAIRIGIPAEDFNVAVEVRALH